MAHALDPSLSGHKQIMEEELIQMWLSWPFQLLTLLLTSIAYSSGKLLNSLPVHTIATSLGGGKSSALPIFHAITGYNG